MDGADWSSTVTSHAVLTKKIELSAVIVRIFFLFLIQNPTLKFVHFTIHINVGDIVMILNDIFHTYMICGLIWTKLGRDMGWENVARIFD